jgi:SAM-dependent methyltransferase
MLVGADVVVEARPVLEGAIDVPSAGARVPAGVLTVQGWAAYGRRPVLDVFVQAGDLPVLRASEQERGDVAEYFGDPKIAECGFRADIDLRHLVGRPEEPFTIEVSVVVDDTQLGETSAPAVATLGSVQVVVDGSGQIPGQQRSEGPSALAEALAHADLGLPFPKEVRSRAAKRFVARLAWPFLHRQLAFNKAVATELSLQRSRSRDDRVTAQAQLEKVRRSLERLVANLGDTFEDLGNELDKKLAAVDDLHREREIANRSQLDLVQRQFFQRHHEDIGALRSELIEIGLELDSVRKQVDGGGGALARAGYPVSSESSDRLRSTYAAFEDTFRGSFDLIKDRAREYLDDVLALDRHGTVLDVGCGRGEWLELLKEAGIEAYGVDLEEEFVTRCVDRGLDARREDALRHLSVLAERSLAAVTAFHLVEHLPTDMTAALIDLSARALHPGGLLIIETPNPENLVVGSSTFYIDPSHVRPLNPYFLEFLVSSRGFVDVDVRFKHPAPALRRPDDDAPWAADLLPILETVNERLFGGQDFAIVARRG